jgi:hypothetical protein
MSEHAYNAVSDATAVRVSLILSIVAVLFSGWTFIMSLDDADVDRALEERLACLELPGDNDCGPTRP